ncbi:MAG: (d)CMP kinase [Ignavibacteria bacterium]|jgi:cytidylate kinase
MSEKYLIAIDGPAGAGKSTIAKMIAGKLGYVYLDTGAMYRAVTTIALEKGIADDGNAVIELAKNIELELTFENGVTKVFVNGEEITDRIRTPEVNAKVSDISRIPEVRKEMVRIQKKMGEDGSLVSEGRDTTTVVFPNADLKIFLTASLDERAKRRYLEYKEKGVETTLEEVKKSIENRDHIDSTRKVSPLKKAENAFEIDSTDMKIEKEIEVILKKLDKLDDRSN